MPEPPAVRTAGLPDSRSRSEPYGLVNSITWPRVIEPARLRAVQDQPVDIPGSPVRRG